VYSAKRALELINDSQQMLTHRAFLTFCFARREQ